METKTETLKDYIIAFQTNGVNPLLVVGSLANYVITNVNIIFKGVNLWKVAWISLSNSHESFKLSSAP